MDKELEDFAENLETTKSELNRDLVKKLFIVALLYPFFTLFVIDVVGINLLQSNYLILLYSSWGLSSFVALFHLWASIKAFSLHDTTLNEIAHLQYSQDKAIERNLSIGFKNMLQFRFLVLSVIFFFSYLIFNL